MSDERLPKPLHARHAISQAEEISRFTDLPADQPISLKRACELIFSGEIGEASLKAEHRRGTLELFKIGRQYFTTRRHIEAMVEMCLVGVPPGSDREQLLMRAQSDANIARLALKASIKRLRQDLLDQRKTNKS
ncbi:hypothetical protein [Bradyrhizobium sp. STM 3809]|uniref:hypothetical protein n=1 Tax=Bradyrhizobium sp. STM 3809 TaxID=551936 RepID=UPI000697A152|nr:hypothetical protein [Bradyrhizobium sp. STM 3809]